MSRGATYDVVMEKYGGNPFAMIDDLVAKYGKEAIYGESQKKFYQPEATQKRRDKISQINERFGGMEKPHKHSPPNPFADFERSQMQKEKERDDRRETVIREAAESRNMNGGILASDFSSAYF